MTWRPESTLQLSSDPVSRDKCIAKVRFKEGSQIFANGSLATILLDKEKGRRCDACFCLSSETSRLKRCSGCGSYWYCNAPCQKFHWNLNHKRICRAYNSHLASAEYQALQDHEKHDSILLSHVFAQMSLLPVPYSPEANSPAATLLTLLPHPGDTVPAPIICSIKPTPSNVLVEKIYARFGNNNFAIHSHLTSIGHGVFPFASRLFNHSCVPNAAAKYHFIHGRAVTMEVVALRDIIPGEEICVPYLDPALCESRQKILQISYGFECGCEFCKYLATSQPLPDMPKESDEMAQLAKQLRDFVGITPSIAASLPVTKIETMPRSLRCVLREEYMASLSELFSNASHEGDYEAALDSGLTLLSLYLLVYPHRYPQIGIHLLELTKTTWNARISNSNLTPKEDKILKERTHAFMLLARQVLDVYGQEGDEAGPLQELDFIASLLSSEPA